MPDQPTYTAAEIFVMIREIEDQEGLLLLKDLLNEEEHLYNLPMFITIMKSFRYRQTELRWEENQRNQQSPE
jgi:hypothetical protein